MTFYSLLLVLITLTGLAWPMALVLVLLATISGFIATRVWYRVACFGIALVLAISTSLGLWIVTHFQFGG